MWKIFKYIFFDMVRNRWTISYCLFFGLLTTGLLMINPDLKKVLISLNNITLFICPLVGVLFGLIYYYNIKEFIELLLTLPLSRKNIFSGIFFGVSFTLILSITVGISIPLIFFGIFSSPELILFLSILLIAGFLSVIFSLLAFIIGIKSENKVKGFGAALFFWMLLALVYDGIFLLILLLLKDYPLENWTLALTFSNPIDLSRIFLLFQTDVSAIMGFTGAVLEKFMGSQLGKIMIMVSLSLWVIIPYKIFLTLANRKDFS